MATRTCPDDDQLIEYVEGVLGARAQRALDAHVDGCAGCRALLAQFAVASPGGSPHAAPPVEEERYELHAVVGSGAMAIVYAAHDRRLGRVVALKVLREPDGADAPRLVREAKAMASLSHPNVVPIYAVGTTAGRRFLAMELVVGETLGEWLRTPRARSAILDAFIQAGRGLAAAHAAGLTHRDFKPSNVLVGADGRVRITDFGLARHADTVSPLTVPGAVVGTPAYMAPEQLRGEPADARSDQFAFCVALYEALHGVRPFPATSLVGLRRALADGRPTRAPSALPRRVTRVLDRGLAVDRADRAPAMDDVVAALEAARAELDAPPSRRWALGLAAAALALAAAAVALGRGPSAPPDRRPVAIAARLDASPLVIPAAAEAGPMVSAALSPPRPVAAPSPPRPVAAPSRPVAAAPAVAPTAPHRVARPPAAAIVAGHRPAVLAALAQLGYQGVALSYIDNQPRDALLATLRAQLAARAPTDLLGQLDREVTLGAALRRHGDCVAARRSFARAAAIDGARSDDRRFIAQWQALAALGDALCQATVDAPAALARLEAVAARGDAYRPTHVEAELALGIVRYELGDRDGGQASYAAAAAWGGNIAGALRTWATAVGAPLPERRAAPPR